MIRSERAKEVVRWVRLNPGVSLRDIQDRFHISISYAGVLRAAASKPEVRVEDDDAQIHPGKLYQMLETMEKTLREQADTIATLKRHLGHSIKRHTR